MTFAIMSLAVLFTWIIMTSIAHTIATLAFDDDHGGVSDYVFLLFWPLILVYSICVILVKIFKAILETL